MAVESRFVVIRNGVEVETFMDKKAADEYDKMLDMADGLADLLGSSAIELSEDAREEIAIYLAKHRDETLIALHAKKPKVAKKPTAKAASAADTEATATNDAAAKLDKAG